MKSRALRAVLVLLALAAQAGAGYQVWRLDEQVAATRSTAVDFERKARLAVLALADLRAVQQATVAEGQVPDTWLVRLDGLVQAAAPRLSELRVSATAPNAQGGLEAAVEAFTAFSQSDAKAREYVKSGQRLSASDIIFTDGASLLTKATNAVDTARAQELVAREIAIDALRVQQLYWIGGAAGVTLLVLLLLLPIPAAKASAETDADAAEASTGSGLGISQVAPRRHDTRTGSQAGTRPLDEIELPPSMTATAPAGSELDRLLDGTAGPDLAAIADICNAFAKVDDPRELQGLLERIAKALDATGIIVWMPEGPQGVLRQALACGYAPLSLTRMGTIDPAADNATAMAYRQKTVQVVASEPHANGAIVAPLITSDGCSGTMSVELKEGVKTTPQLKAVTTILAAQLATLITPASPPPAAGSAAPRA